MICQMCRRKFNPDKEPGAILISPPFLSACKLPKGDIYRKWHICPDCFTKLIRWICLFKGRLKVK